MASYTSVPDLVSGLTSSALDFDRVVVEIDDSGGFTVTLFYYDGVWRKQATEYDGVVDQAILGAFNSALTDIGE